MSLEQWLEYKWVSQHQTSSEEIVGLLTIAERDIENAQIKGLSIDWRLNIAHNAALQAANAALYAAGYRAEREAHHYRIIQSLEYTIAYDSSTIAKINILHKKRNIASYTSAGTISIKEAEEMLALAKDIYLKVTLWIQKYKPELLIR